jgi:hypothetical protein
MSVALVLVLANRAHAESPPQSDPAETVESELEPGPTADPERMARTAELAEAGQRKFDASDFDGAIAIWTEAFEALPDDSVYAAARATLLVYLAHAHVQAFAIDNQLVHLRTASGLFADYLATLDPSDEANRARIQGELDAINVAEDEFLARTEEIAKREHETLILAWKEVESAQAKLAAGERARARRARRAYWIGGGTTLGLGLASTGLMVTGLVAGQFVDRRGTIAANNPTTPDARYSTLLAEGRRANAMAWGGGVAAAVLVSVGVSLLVLARKRRGQVSGGAAQARSWVPTRVGALEVRF